MRVKLPPEERRRIPVYVLLRRDEKELVEEIAEGLGTSQAAVLRDAFLSLLSKGHYGKALKKGMAILKKRRKRA